MSKIKVKTIDFESKKVEDKTIETSFEIETDNLKSASDVVRWQLAKRRSGSAKVKSMSEISGTTAKPWKQKGTGRARQGSRRSVQFVGGRTCHGPNPRSFDFTMPKKVVKKALSDVLKIKLQENRIILFSNKSTSIKTSKINSVLLENKITSALIVDDIANSSIYKSVRNIKNFKTISATGINVYDIMSFDYLFVNENVFESKILEVIK